MKEQFIKKKFGAEASEMIETINGILDDYAGQGYDLSLRQLYYQLVSKNLLTNEEKSYKNLGSLVSDARLAGLIDWDMIKDRGREMLANPHWDNPKDFLESVTPQYRFDLWERQSVYVEVMVEKQALEGVLIPVCRLLDVPFTANKGYSSSSALYEASKRYMKAAHGDKELFVIYLGDHDPSGIDMSRDVKDRLDLFTGYDVQVQRVALNMDQVEALNPPENPAKISDSRANSYIAQFGHSSWELDAIEPAQLAQIVQTAVSNIMDLHKFEADRKKQEAERKKLLKFAKKYFED